MMTRSLALADNLPALLRFAQSLTRDASAAEDLVQDTIVRALERHDRFDASRNYRTWLFALTHNLFVDGLRRRRVQDSAVSSMILAREAEAEPNQEHAAMLRETLKAFEALPLEQRAVLHLVVIEGGSYSEVAEILGTPIGTVMSRLSRARQSLRSPATPKAAGHLKLVSNHDA